MELIYAFVMAIAIITSTPCNVQGWNGCVSWENGWSATGTIQLKEQTYPNGTKHFFDDVIYHEYAHYKLQKYFDPLNPKSNEVIKFWKKQPILYDKDNELYNIAKELPYEKMAQWYENWVSDYEFPPIPKAIKKWFKIYLPTPSLSEATLAPPNKSEATA